MDTTKKNNSALFWIASYNLPNKINKKLIIRFFTSLVFLVLVNPHSVLASNRELDKKTISKTFEFVIIGLILGKIFDPMSILGITKRKEEEILNELTKGVETGRRMWGYKPPEQQELKISEDLLELVSSYCNHTFDAIIEYLVSLGISQDFLIRLIILSIFMGLNQLLMLLFKRLELIEKRKSRRFLTLLMLFRLINLIWFEKPEYLIF